MEYQKASRGVKSGAVSDVEPASAKGSGERRNADSDEKGEKN
jgi:hypothetical protein